jgi:hypothetical protein
MGGDATPAASPIAAAIAMALISRYVWEAMQFDYGSGMKDRMNSGAMAVEFLAGV